MRNMPTKNSRINSQKQHVLQNITIIKQRYYKVF